MDDEEIIGFNKFTHFFIAVTSASRLYRFTTRSLFLKYKFHPSFESFTSHTIWCQKPYVSFNSAFSIDLSKVNSLTFQDFMIKIELCTKQLQSSKCIGVANVRLGSFDIMEINSKPIYFFYNKDKATIYDINNNNNNTADINKNPELNSVGRFEIVIALGFSDQMSSICPPLRFQAAKILLKKPPNSSNKIRNNFQNYNDNVNNNNTIKKEGKEKHKNEELWSKNNWISVTDLLNNWKEYALLNGWTGPQNLKICHNDSTIIESNINENQVQKVPYQNDDQLLSLETVYISDDNLFSSAVNKKCKITRSFIAERCPALPISLTLVEYSSIFNTYLNHQYDYDFLFESESDIDRNIDQYLKENSPNTKLQTISNYRSAPTTPFKGNSYQMKNRKDFKGHQSNKNMKYKTPDLKMAIHSNNNYLSMYNSKNKKQKRNSTDLIKLSPSLENIINGKEPYTVFSIDDIDYEEEEESYNEEPTALFSLLDE